MQKELSNVTLGDLFVKLGLPWFEEKHEDGLFLRTRDCLFNHAMTMWLMVVQKRRGLNSLASAVQSLKYTTKLDAVAKLVSGSKKLLHSQMSNNAGAFCQARQKLPLSKVEEFCDHMSKKVEDAQDCQVYGYSAYILDGSTIGLQKNAAILSQFAAQENQHGKFYPVARIVTAHNIVSGTALRPEISSTTESEQSLSQLIMERISKGALILGDRNFGIFSVAWFAKQSGLKSLVRLQESRARKILGKKPKEKMEDGEYAVNWSASKQDLEGNDFPNEACVTGRVVIVTQKRKGFKPQYFYFFTTAKELSIEQIMDIYKKRWFIETDLRTIKGTIDLDTIEAQTPDVARKEILLGILAYTLVRSIIAKGAQAIELEPRDISFKRGFEYITAFSIRIQKSTDIRDLSIVLAGFLPGLRQLKHPNRTSPRVEPRAIATVHRKKFPSMKGSRDEARGNIIIGLRT